jgi:phosphocarrier protein HPr
MVSRQIKLSQTKDVEEFVRAAEKCDFDINIFYNRFIIDAKSILGILSMDLTKVLTVEYGGENSAFEHILNRFSAA